MHRVKGLFRPMLLLLTAVLLLSAQVYAAAEIKVGSVQADALRIRKEPALSATILTRAYEDEFVVVLEETNSEWCKVNYKGTTGYVAAAYIDIVEEADFDSLPGRVTGTHVNVRTEATTKADKLGQVSTGDAVSVTGVEGGWYKVSFQGKPGYIHPDYLQLDFKAEVIPEAVTAMASVNIPNADADLSVQLVAYAKAYLGTPYKYGSMSGKSFDCSGFTSYVFKHFGVTLNRSAAGQLSNGAAVDKAGLQPGDLVLFSDKSINKAAASHVGIYIGNDEFIHASSRRNGGGVIISSLSDSYYTRVYKAGRRVI